MNRKLHVATKSITIKYTWIIGGLLGKLGGLSDLQKQAEEANKKKKEDLAALMKHMADKNHLGNFLDNFQRPVVKRGVCKYVPRSKRDEAVLLFVIFYSPPWHLTEFNMPY